MRILLFFFPSSPFPRIANLGWQWHNYIDEHIKIHRSLLSRIFGWKSRISQEKCSSWLEGLILSRTYADRKFIGISCKSAQKPALPGIDEWRWRRLTFNVVGHCRCVLSPLNPSVVRSFPIFNWIFSLAGEVIYPFYLRAESRIPIERKLN